MFTKNFANDGIRTADLRFGKRLICQLSHNHCPAKGYVVSCWWTCGQRARLTIEGSPVRIPFQLQGKSMRLTSETFVLLSAIFRALVDVLISTIPVTEDPFLL